MVATAKPDQEPKERQLLKTEVEGQPSWLKLLWRKGLHGRRNLATKLVWPALAAFMLVLMTAAPSLGAERLTLQFGFFGRAVPVSSLESFSQGKLDRHLAGLLAGLDDTTLSQLQSALATPAPEDPLVFSQKLRTPMGTRLLQTAGLTVKTGAGLNGQIALRAALSKAAEAPDGLSVLNILHHFPTPGVNLDLMRALSIKDTLQRAIQDTDHWLTAIAAQADREAADPATYASLPDLRQQGPYAVRFIELNLVDESRDRTVPADLFLPNIANAEEGSIPVVVFSHGLGHSRIYFRDIAKHLATYGFAVAMPEHLGSNESQRWAMETWLSSEFFQRREFVNRPQDISFLLDELERLNGAELHQRLNMQKVGAIGHSFGGYTVLAAAGATVDFAWLRQQCTPDTHFLANISQLLQCRALESEAIPADRALLSQGGLRDGRIQLVMTFNTVSNLFGQQGMARIQIPTLIAGGVYDFVTPVIPEQIDTFRWLTTPDKYFLLVDQKAHGDESTRTLWQFVYALEDELDIKLAQWWLRSNYKALLVAFAETYLAGRQDYRAYLEAGYARYISVDPFWMHLVRNFDYAVTKDGWEHSPRKG